MQWQLSRKRTGVLRKDKRKILLFWGALLLFHNFFCNQENSIAKEIHWKATMIWMGILVAANVNCQHETIDTEKIAQCNAALFFLDDWWIQFLSTIIQMLIPIAQQFKG